MRLPQETVDEYGMRLVREAIAHGEVHGAYHTSDATKHYWRHFDKACRGFYDPENYGPDGMAHDKEE